MKKLLLLTIVPVVLPFFGISQDYEIANWYNFKKGAVSLTFDDWYNSHPTFAIPAMNARDMVGTFYVNNLNNYSGAIQAIADGHEIANHTYAHKHLLTLSGSELKFEINDFLFNLEAALGSPVRTFAYPFGEGGEADSSSHYVQDTVAKHHIAARSVMQQFDDAAYQYDFAPDDRDYYQIKTIHMSNNLPGYASTFDNVIENGGLMTYMFHAIGEPAGWDNIDTANFTRFLDTLKYGYPDIWVATLEEAVQYHRERKGATLVTTSAPFNDGNTWKLELTDTVIDSEYDHPLSIKLTIPSPITAIMTATQNGSAIPFEVVNDTVIFNAIPDGGEIVFDILDCVQGNNQINVTGNTTFCSPDSVWIEANYDSNYTYEWFKDSVSFGTDTNKIMVTEQGDYFALISLNGCPIYTEMTSVTVTGVCGVPVAGFYSNTQNEILDENIAFMSSSTNLEGGETYYWDFGADASLSPGYYGEGPVLVSYSSPGLKTVSLTVTGSNGNTVEQKTDYIEIANIEKCGIYKEDFNDTSNLEFVGCHCDYSAEEVNGAFRITTRKDTIANEWYWIGFWFYKDTTLTPLDFSDPNIDPVLKIRAKASDTCRLTFSLADTSHNSTAGITLNQKGFINVTTEYQEFELDFSDLFFYQWSNTDVDSTQIAYVKIAFDAGWKNYSFTNSFGQFVNKQFDGHVDIDWISIGEKCDYDSLFTNIVLPDTVCVLDEFNVWNHSNPEIENASLNWSFDNGATISDTVVFDELPMTLSYQTPGTKSITLELTDEQGRVHKVTEKVHVKDCSVGIDELGQISRLTIFNPVQGSIRGTLHSLDYQQAMLVLQDMNGKALKSQNLSLTPGQNTLNVNVADVSTGTYQLTVYSAKGKVSEKLIIQ